MLTEYVAYQFNVFAWDLYFRRHYGCVLCQFNDSSVNLPVNQWRYAQMFSRRSTEMKYHPVLVLNLPCLPHARLNPRTLTPKISRRLTLLPQFGAST